MSRDPFFDDFDDDRESYAGDFHSGFGFEDGRPVPVTVHESDYRPQGPEHEAAPIFRFLIATLRQAKNPVLTVDCLSVVSGVCYDGESLTDIATRHGVTRQAISKRCSKLVKRIGVKPSGVLRSSQTRERCRESRLARVRLNRMQGTFDF